MRVSARWMRGGTSKCWVFDAADLDETGFSADAALPRIFGSPDLRQLDGVGGATSTTSKALIVERGDGSDIDVSYTFAQVGIEEAKVDWGSNCGNCSAAVGLFALESGWVPLRPGATEVRTYNTNTGQVIIQTIPTPGARLPDDPQELIPGTVFTGHGVELGFVSPEGKTTGVLLPTGAPVSEFAVAEGRTVRASLVDAGAPLVMVDAESFGLAPQDYAVWAGLVSERLSELDGIRRAAAVRMGLAETPEAAERAIPKVGVVSGSPDGEADLQVLMLSMGRPHPAMPITGSVGVTVAARTPGTTVAESLGGVVGEELRIRIPVGVLSTFTADRPEGRAVGVRRTARTLAEAQLLVPDGHLERAAEAMSAGAAS
ncbi:PrpF domain-containing protein [Brevibacterium album]|uniref:PrpF domain-containing protein n=1 Tax=Brevibacterium album TaxID=417948 RepID=UPI00040B1B37|nr:PrpF domain-containing protein [Brevibacterium album]